jgi:hypothetical protein
MGGGAIRSAPTAVRTHIVTIEDGAVYTYL